MEFWGPAFMSLCWSLNRLNYESKVITNDRMPSSATRQNDARATSLREKNQRQLVVYECSENSQAKWRLLGLAALSRPVCFTAGSQMSAATRVPATRAWLGCRQCDPYCRAPTLEVSAYKCISSLALFASNWWRRRQSRARVIAITLLFRACDIQSISTRQNTVTRQGETDKSNEFFLLSFGETWNWLDNI